MAPALLIVDPQYQLWIRPGWRYLVDELVADTNIGHNIVATLYRAVPDRSYRPITCPVEMRPVFETKLWRQALRPCLPSGLIDAGLGRTPASLVHADLRLGSRVQSVLTAQLRAGGDRFRSIRYITSWDADSSINNSASPLPPVTGHHDKTVSSIWIATPLDGLASPSTRISTIRRFTDLPNMRAYVSRT